MTGALFHDVRAWHQSLATIPISWFDFVHNAVVFSGDQGGIAALASSRTPKSALKQHAPVSLLKGQANIKGQSNINRYFPIVDGNSRDSEPPYLSTSRLTVVTHDAECQTDRTVASCSGRQQTEMQAVMQQKLQEMEATHRYVSCSGSCFWVCVYYLCHSWHAAPVCPRLKAKTTPCLATVSTIFSVCLHVNRHADCVQHQYSCCLRVYLLLLMYMQAAAAAIS